MPPSGLLYPAQSCLALFGRQMQPGLGSSFPRSFIHWSVCPFDTSLSSLLSPGPHCLQNSLSWQDLSSPQLYTLPLPTAFEVCKVHRPRNQKEHDAGPVSPTQGSSSPPATLPSPSLDPPLFIPSALFPSLLALHQPMGPQALKKGALVSSKHP